MASIQSLGVGSGLLTSELVEDIIQAERKSKDLRLETKRAEVEARISSFASIRSAVSEVNTAVAALSSSTTLLASTATSSAPTAVSASALATAEVGVHSVEVTSLARRQTLKTSRYDQIDSIFGSGTLNIRFGTTAVDNLGVYTGFVQNTERAAISITIPEDRKTLAGVRDAINQSGNGITASIVNDGQGFVLVLNADSAGEDNSLEITVTEGTTPGLSALSYRLGAATAGVNLTQTVAASDAVATIDGVTISRETNTIDGVVAGVTFNLLSTTTSAATVSVSRDETAINERMNKFVDSFNRLKTMVDDLTKFDEKEKVGALLIGDSILRGIRSQMRKLLTGGVSGLSNPDIRALVDIGVRTDQNNGYALTFNSARFRSALSRDAAAVRDLLTDSSSATDPEIRVASFQRSTEAGSYSVFVSQLATQGTNTGDTVASLDNPVTIDGNSDSLGLVIDGVGAAISLTHGVYANGSALASELQNQINDTPAFRNGGIGVSVTYDTTLDRLQIRSNTFGSSSRVGITSLDPDVTAKFGLVVGDGESTRGVDAAGTINGLEAPASGQFLSAPLGPQPASAGVFKGSAITALDTPPLVIDDTNNEFILNVDGTASGLIRLTAGNYATAQSLVAEVQARIDADSALQGMNATVKVAFNSATRALEFTSESRGDRSKVDVIFVGEGVPASLGLAARAGVPGRNATEIADKAGGLQIQVLGGALGDRGEVTLVRGVMSQFNRFLSTALSFTGSIQNRVSTLEAELQEIDEEGKEFDKRMDLMETRLRTQFAAADALISKLNSTGKYLDQQLANLPGYRRKE